MNAQNRPLDRGQRASAGRPIIVMTGDCRRSAQPVPWWAERRHPLWTAVALTAAPIALTGVAAVIAALLIPSVGENSNLVPRLGAVLLLAAGAGLVVARARGWRRVGAGNRSTQRHVGLLGVPAAIALAPLATGLNLPAASTLAVLVVGYAATGVFEELWHRGVIQDSIRGIGLRRAAVTGGALFALSHLANVFFGQPLAVTLAQSVGAFCFGVGFSILRWRTNAIWLLATIHGVGDLMFKITNLHGLALWGAFIAHDTLILMWGLWVLRGMGNDLGVPPRQAS